MPHEILSVKLCELDDRIGRLHGRVHLSESACHSRLRQEIESMGRECEAAELALGQRLQYSRSETARALSRAYEQIRQIIDNVQARPGPAGDADQAAEEKILLAEYALDFAVQAADRALLTAMEAIEAEMTQNERTKEGNPG